MCSPAIKVTFGAAESVQSTEFTTSFRIGRVKRCGVCINSEFVSREHVDVVFRNDRWWITDLDSRNGIFVGDERVHSAPVDCSLEIRLGFSGPTVLFEVESRILPPVPADSLKDEDRFAARYFGQVDDGEALGEHTLMVRRVFQQVQTRQRRKYGWAIGALCLLIAGATGYTVYLRGQVGKNRDLAQDLFYSMKALDVNIAGIEKVLMETGDERGREQIRKNQAQRSKMEKDYDQFLRTLRVYDPAMTEKDRLILRIARIFGESELAMPPEFAAEVGRYIQQWQSSGRLGAAVAVAKEKGYDKFIAQEFLAQNLPPEFFYLALQESNFDTWASGPITRMGYAKGMWQFIPETGSKYGLKIGPLVQFARADPGDDRQRYDLATRAAAHYIKDLYSTDAQASGLLVMACYNWGDERVLPLVRSMPANPKERNFWKFLAKYRDRIPPETYNYVFWIVSAAVIGENPRLFGFDFDSPLAQQTR